MSQHSDHEREAAAARLEQHLTQMLREQPLQRAPTTLALRVMTSIESRRRSAFQRWPLGVRLAFVALAALTAQLTMELTTWLGSAVNAGIAAPRPPLIAILAEAALAASRQLPSAWIYAVLFALTLIYGGMFGVGVAMYRTVHPRH